MKQALMFGAGNIGRGFLGQLFSESGYEVVFVDIDETILNKLNDEHHYELRLVDNEQTIIKQIAPVRAIHSKEVEQIAACFCEASIGATAVGARVLPFIAPVVAAGIQRRAALGVNSPINLIICENLKDAAAYFRSLVLTHLDEQGKQYLAQWVGFVDTVIGRMVPPLTDEMRKADPTLIMVEPYQHLPVDKKGFVGEIPSIQNMEPKDSFEAYTAMKLYIHNCGHAVLSYLGYLKGYEYGYEALQDKDIFTKVKAAMSESTRAIARQYGLDIAALNAHVDDLLQRFQNRALGDTIFRLGRDPIRKLAESDRLVGAARLVERTGGEPLALSLGIAAAFCFNAPDDAIAQELQQRICLEGLENVLKSVTGIDADEPLGKKIVENYQCL